MNFKSLNDPYSLVPKLGVYTATLQTIFYPSSSKGHCSSKVTFVFKGVKQKNTIHDFNCRL